MVSFSSSVNRVQDRWGSALESNHDHKENFNANRFVHGSRGNVHSSCWMSVRCSNRASIPSTLVIGLHLEGCASAYQL